MNKLYRHIDQQEQFIKNMEHIVDELQMSLDEHEDYISWLEEEIRIYKKTVTELTHDYYMEMDRADRLAVIADSLSADGPVFEIDGYIVSDPMDI